MGLSQRSVLICSILRITAPFYTPFFLFPPPYSPFPFIFPHWLAYFYQPSSSPSTLRFAKPRFACSFLIACQLWCLMRFVSYLCLCYVCLSDLCLCSCLQPPSSLIIHFLHWKGPWPYTLRGAEALSFHTDGKLLQWVGWTTSLFLVNIKGKESRTVRWSLTLWQGIILIIKAKYVI